MRKTFLSIIAVATLSALSLPAGAHGGRGYSGARVGVYIGAPVVIGGYWGPRPYYYAPYPYYYTPAPVIVREVVREPLVFYDERGNPVPPAKPQTQAQAPAQASPQPGTSAPTWFYCADSQSYHPYVESCASPWQRVVPHPPPQ